MAEKRATLLLALKDRASSGLRSFGTRLDRVAKNLDRSKFVFAAVAAGIGFLGKAALKAAGDFEQWRISFTTMLGSAERADILLNKIKDFAKETPFDLPQVVTGAQRLLAFGIEADNVIDTFKTLGDISSIVGTEKLPSIVLAFGKIRTKGKATMEELNILLEAGVPILDELSNNFGVTSDQIFKMVSTGKVGFEDVNKALKTLTGEGGIAFNAMSKQMNSLQGKISNVGDVAFQLGQSFGTLLLPIAKRTSDVLIIMGEKLLGISRSKKMVVLAIGAITVAMAGLTAVVAGFIAISGPIVAAFGLIGTVLLPLVAIITTISALVIGLKDDFILLKDFAVDTIKGIINKFREWFELLFPNLARLVSFFGEKFFEGLEIFKEKFQVFKEEFANDMAIFGDTLKKPFTDMFDWAKKKFAGVSVEQGKSSKAVEKEVDKLSKSVTKKFKELFSNLTQGNKEFWGKFAENAAQARTLVGIVAGQITDIFGRESKAAFLASKAAAIANAIVNTARGVSLALATIPFPFSVAAASTIKALGAAQVGIIAGQTIQGFQEGGIIPATPGGRIIRVAEGGQDEAVVPLNDRFGNNITINSNVLVGSEDSVRDLAKMIDEELFALRRNNESVSFDDS